MGGSGKNKNIAKTAARNGTHKVLLFGDALIGDLTQNDMKHPNASIDIIPFPKGWEQVDRLTQYTLVILDYSAFLLNEGADIEKQNVFEKLLNEALDFGTSFCFVHYDESVPMHSRYEHDNAYMNKKSFRQHRELQIGFRILSVFSIKPHHYDSPLTGFEIHRNELRPFISKWGASHNYFSTYSSRNIDDLICSVGKYPVGFAMYAKSGLIFFLPFQRDFSRKKDFVKGLVSLIDCLLTYITKTLTEIPPWARNPFFEEEHSIADECKALKEKLDKKTRELDPFMEAKQLLCQSEYNLESSIPSFIEKNLGILTEQDEQFKEDFWIIDESEKKVICEVKSYVKGFKKSGIYSLYNHRESRKLPGNFPALLIVNCNLQAGSWVDKGKPIDRQDYEAAATNNIIIMRVEDLVRFWDMLRVGATTSLKLLSLLNQAKGWLEVTQNNEIVVHE